VSDVPTYPDAEESAPAQQWTVRSPEDLGRAVARVRRARGLTQAGVAGRTGVERTYLARLEAGASVLLLERSLRVLEQLGATVVVTWADDD
jgi:transcriptional regulator with XRE-family HTH domain